MLREIKFIYWDLITEDWVGFDLNTSPPPYGCKVFQYTGVNDRNESEIYEGDIVSYPQYGRDGEPLTKYVVSFYSGGFSLDEINGCYGGICMKLISQLKYESRSDGSMSGKNSGHISAYRGLRNQSTKGIR